MIQKLKLFIVLFKMTLWSLILTKEGEKQQGNRLFSLCPVTPLKAVRQECQDTLHRGYIEDNQVIDFKTLKTLHKNACAFMQEGGKEEIKEGSIKKFPQTFKSPHPFIFYESVINDEGLEELTPYLYMPKEMMAEAGDKGKIRARMLALFPQGTSCGQIENAFKAYPAMEEKLQDFFQTLTLTQKRPSLLDHNPTDLSSFPTVTLQGDVEADLLGLLNKGTIKMHGDIHSKKALVASLYGNVVLESLVQRTYLGNRHNFVDKIPQKARIQALDETLDILAGQHIIFQGSETYSKDRSHFIALGHLFDVPVPLLLNNVMRRRMRLNENDTYGSPTL
jgi:hypothetical protein